jgi:uncharacterized protein (DUF58 family)
VRPELEQACLPFHLVLPTTPLQGSSGVRLGRGTGSSLEFMDFRDYVPGDDLRHVDWRAYARTDRLQVRLYREEIAPVVDVVTDLSPSMAVTEAKTRALRDLVEALVFWAGEAGSRARRLSAQGEFADAESATFDAPADPRVLMHLPVRPRSLRVLLSDFLFPQDPSPLIRSLAAGAADLVVLQLLDPWELDPAADSALTLVDAESGERRELLLGGPALKGYRERLLRLRDGVARAAHGVGARYALVGAQEPSVMFRSSLLPQGIITPW